MEQIKGGCANMAVLLPLASTSLSHTSTEAEIYYGLAKAVDVSLELGPPAFQTAWKRRTMAVGQGRQHSSSRGATAAGRNC